MVYPTDHSAEPSSQFTFKRISGVCTFCDRHVTRAQFCRGPDTGHRCQLGDYVLGGLGHCWARRPAWLGDSSIRLVTTRSRECAVRRHESVIAEKEVKWGASSPISCTQAVIWAQFLRNYRSNAPRSGALPLYGRPTFVPLPRTGELGWRWKSPVPGDTYCGSTDRSADPVQDAPP